MIHVQMHLLSDFCKTTRIVQNISIANLLSTKYNYISKLLNLQILFIIKGFIVNYLYIWVLFKFVLWWGDEHYFLPSELMEQTDNKVLYQNMDSNMQESLLRPQCRFVATILFLPFCIDSTKRKVRFPYEFHPTMQVCRQPRAGTYQIC